METPSITLLLVSLTLLRLDIRGKTGLLLLNLIATYASVVLPVPLTVLLKALLDVL